MSTIATLWFDKVAPLQLYRTIKLPRAGLSIDKAAVFHHNLWALALGKLSPIFFLIFCFRPGKPARKAQTRQTQHEILDPCLCLAYVFFLVVHAFGHLLEDLSWGGAVQIMRDGAALYLQPSLPPHLLCCFPAWLPGFVQQTCMLAILHAYIAALLPSKIDPLLFLTNNTYPRILEPCLCFLCFSVCLLRLGSRLLDLSLGFRGFRV